MCISALSCFKDKALYKYCILLLSKLIHYGISGVANALFKYDKECLTTGIHRSLIIFISRFLQNGKTLIK